MGDDLEGGILLGSPLRDDFLLEDVHEGHATCSLHLQYDSSPTAVLEAFRLDHPYVTTTGDEGSQSDEDLPLCPKLSDESSETTDAVKAKLGAAHRNGGNQTLSCEDEDDGTDVEGFFDDDSLSLSLADLPVALQQDCAAEESTHAPYDGPICDESTLESQLVATLRKASPTKYNARKRSELLMLVRKGKQQNLLPKPPKRQTTEGAADSPPMAPTRKNVRRGAYKLDHKRSWTNTQQGLCDAPLSQTCWDNERQNKRKPIRPFEPKTIVVQEIEFNEEIAREILLENQVCRS